MANPHIKKCYFIKTLQIYISNAELLLANFYFTSMKQVTFTLLMPLYLGTALANNINVPPGGNLQAALNAAQSGDIITLQAGTTFTGHYTLAPNNGATITIQSSAMSALPAGQRVSPGQASSMAKLVTPDSNSVLTIPAGANNYKIQGLEFTENPGVYVNDLIRSGTGSETSTSQLPNNIDFDRVYVHADPVSGGKRGIALNSANTTVENSYFADFISTWQDTQAILGWNGSGPFLIQNNHLEAGTEIVGFGGAVPAISGLIPSNITVQNNEFFKPTRYYAGSPDYAGIKVWAKNHFELKNAQNVLVQNNTFTNNFQQADQLGFVILLNVRDEGGQVPWATVSHVTVKNNIFNHIGGGAFLMGHDSDGGGTAGDFNFVNNLWEDIGVFGGSGRMYEILNGVNGVKIDHDTAFPTSWLLDFDQRVSSGITVTNSIYTEGAGIAGNGTSVGEPTMAYYDADGRFQNNLIIGGNPAQYSGSHFANNMFVSAISQVGFNNPSAGDYSLSPNSPYSHAALDGGPLGVSLSSPSSNPPPPPAPGIPTGWTQIISKNSGKCIDVPWWTGSNWGLQQGLTLQQWGCWGGDNQKFQISPVSGGYKIITKISGQSFDIAGGPSATGNGVPLTQWRYWGGSNQTFQITLGSDGYYTIQPVNSGKCLDVTNSSTANGAPIQQWSCWGSDDQKWSLSPTQ